MFNFFAPKVPQISVDEVMKEINDKKDFILLDVRTDEEFAKKRIANCIHVPLDNISQNIEKIIPDKNKTVYVYCLSGYRSDCAVAEMIKIGYKNVFSMTSGLLAWRPKGYPLDEKEVQI